MKALAEVLKYPVLIGLLAFDLCVVVPLSVCSAYYVGSWWIMFLTVSQTPVWVMVAREVIRQMRMLPMSEAWEISPEKWEKTLQEYIDEAKKKR